MCSTDRPLLLYYGNRVTEGGAAHKISKVTSNSLDLIDSLIIAPLIRFKLYDVLYKYIMFMSFVLSAFYNKDVM